MTETYSDTHAYFALDGNYGSANQLVVVDTALWTIDDWDLIDSVSDWERPNLAQGITKKREHEQNKQSLTNSTSTA